ncbi:MAG: energy transducer TonB [Myxococcales bacterium]|nr:energy transducer TonB [Myxococcales bacterium]
MRRGPCIALLLFACAHQRGAPSGEEAPLAAGQPATFAEGTVPPVRKKCRRGGPQIAAGDRASGRIVLDYLITEEGKVREVTVSGDASAGAVKAIRAFLVTCSYQPATHDGKAVAVKWKGELRFPVTTAPASR